METNNPLDLIITRRIKAPRQRVWTAWSNPEHLKHWWCPRPWTTEVKAFDLRPGGAFHTFMSGPEGGTSDNPGCFLEVVPAQKLVMTSALVADYRPAENPWLSITSIVTFEDVEDDTLYTARVLHASEASAKQHLDMGFHEGWGIMLAQLEAYAQELA